MSLVAAAAVIVPLSAVGAGTAQAAAVDCSDGLPTGQGDWCAQPAAGSSGITEDDCTDRQVFDPNTEGGMCVTVQLPSERIGRQTTREDGAICTVTGVNPDTTTCTEPTPTEVPSAAPAPQATPAATPSAPVARVDAQPTRPAPATSAPASGTADAGTAPAELDGEQAPVLRIDWASFVRQILAVIEKVL